MDEKLRFVARYLDGPAILRKLAAANIGFLELALSICRDAGVRIKLRYKGMGAYVL